VRTDLGESAEIPATIDHIDTASLDRRTTLRAIGQHGEATVATPEHLLSACMGLGITHLRIEMDGPEVPLLDGSAQQWVDAFSGVGSMETRTPSRICWVDELFCIHVGDAELTYVPASDALSCAVFLEYSNHPILGHQGITWTDQSELYREEIAAARTFVLMEDLERLRNAGLIKGGSLDGAVVVTSEGYLCKDGLRFPDEPVRHKALDLIGDLALLGPRLRGHILARKSGHASHAALVMALREKLDAEV